MTTTSPKATLTTDEIATLRAALETLRVENLADLEAATNTRETLVADHTAIEPSLHEVMTNAEYMIEDATRILGLIDGALERIDAGEYGNCEQCRELIPFARLELRPYGTLCVRCSQ
jgi:DnaK suppressor protein